jgi:hypothetical protein
MQTHGDLPCPACGYLRRGLDHAKACPECGARGFHGDLVVSGEPEVHKESRRAGCVGRTAVNISFWSTMAGWFFARNSDWSEVLAISALALLGVALALWIHGWIRRRNERAAGGTLERIVWEFEADAIRVRECDVEYAVPYSRIVKLWPVPGFMASRRTRVQLETRRGTLKKPGFPTIMLCGTTQAQRETVTAMKERIEAARSAS